MTGARRCLVLGAVATVGLWSITAPAPAEAQRRPSASTCDIARRQGRVITGCAQRAAPRAAARPAAPPPNAGPAVSARLIQPGRHRCQVSREYAFRPCTVTMTGPGRYELVVPDGLLGLRGELEERGGALRFSGRLTDELPFICAGNRNTPDYEAAVERCRSQPVTFVLRRGRNGWAGDIADLRQLQTQYVGARPPERHPVSHELVPYEATPLTILD